MSWKLWIPAVKGIQEVDILSSWPPVPAVYPHTPISILEVYSKPPLSQISLNTPWCDGADLGRFARDKSVYLFSVLLWWAEIGHGRSILHHTAIRALFFQRAGEPLSTHHCRHPHFLNRGIVTLYSVSLPLYCLRNTLNIATCYWNSFLISGADGVFSWFSCPFGNLTQFLSKGRDEQLSSSIIYFKSPYDMSSFHFHANMDRIRQSLFIALIITAQPNSTCSALMILI